MVFLNYTTMQMTAKIVYYGPGLCGKTTNLQWIHGKTAPNSRGEMVSLETETDRTLFFDLLPLDVGIIGGLKVRLQLYTVPGQVFYNATRRLVLKGVDGVVFVADSQAPALEPNEESLANLKQNLEELGLNVPDVPLVLQYNKRDLRNILAGREAPGRPQPHRGTLLRGRGDPRRGGLRDPEGDLAPRPAGGAGSAGRGRTHRLPALQAGVHISSGPSPRRPPPEDQPPAAADPALMEPLQVEFAEEDTDKVKVRAVETKGSYDIGTELRKLRRRTKGVADRRPRR